MIWSDPMPDEPVAISPMKITSPEPIRVENTQSQNVIKASVPTKLPQPSTRSYGVFVYLGVGVVIGTLLGVVAKSVLFSRRYGDDEFF